MSVIKTNTVRDSKPLWRFGNMPLTMVSQTKSESGLTKEAMWPPIVSSIVCFLVFLIFFLLSSLLDKNSTV